MCFFIKTIQPKVIMQVLVNFNIYLLFFFFFLFESADGTDGSRRGKYERKFKIRLHSMWLWYLILKNKNSTKRLSLQQVRVDRKECEFGRLGCRNNCSGGGKASSERVALNFNGEEKQKDKNEEKENGNTKKMKKLTAAICVFVLHKNLIYTKSN